MVVAESSLRRLRVEIHGAVQGVGFRPFVYRLATELGLAGWVINDSAGVFIEVEGPVEVLTRFLERLPAEVPPRAIVQSLQSDWLDPAGYRSFEIRHSDDSGVKTVLVLPDIATCPDCLAEVFDPADRRYGYPFTNCTNCGPRFSIIQALPYDRPNTTMRRFIMCPRCQAEYDSPLDRRFHAQPNACPVCGPRVAFYGESANGESANRRIGESANRRISESANQRISESANRRISESANQRIGESANQRISESANQRISESANQRSEQPQMRTAGFEDGLSTQENRGVSRSAAQGERPAEASTPDDESTSALRAAADALRAGQIVAVKGLGGFLLLADATNDEAVARLRERKRRSDKPFAIMVRDVGMARQLCEVSAEAETLLTSAETPIVLLPKCLPAGGADTPGPEDYPNIYISPSVAPDNPYLGIMLPYMPLHHLLLREIGRPLVATSGNLADEPICTDNDEAFRRLGHLADAFLVHDRPIARHVDDSVAWIVAGASRLLRRARGYAPLPVLLKQDVPTILAVGAHLKNTVALSVGRQVFISQHIGDLETPEAMGAFERVIADFLRLYEAQPVAIAHDMHPEYLSTKWVVETWRGGDGGKESKEDKPIASFMRPRVSASLRLVPVQHHHAHLAACLAENQVEGPALGVTWDGTGYGPDGTVWGGEFLLGDAFGYQRVAHLRPFRLPGSEAAVHEPRRVALALLWELYGEAALAMDDLAPVMAFTPAERRVLGQMLARGVNAPLTTSMGRLFDGVAALVGLHQQVSYEGQAAMRLEFVVDMDEAGVYPIALQPATNASKGEIELSGVEASAGFARRPEQLAKASIPEILTLDWEPLIKAVLADVRRGTPAGVISARFHNGLVHAMIAVARVVGQPRVALTGGCFQNRILTERAAAGLMRAGFEVLLHRHVPPNDGGISLGQVAVAAVRAAGDSGQ